MVALGVPEGRRRVVNNLILLDIFELDEVVVIALVVVELRLRLRSVVREETLVALVKRGRAVAT